MANRKTVQIDPTLNKNSAINQSPFIMIKTDMRSDDISKFPPVSSVQSDALESGLSEEKPSSELQKQLDSILQPKTTSEMDPKAVTK